MIERLQVERLQVRRSTSSVGSASGAAFAHQRKNADTSEGGRTQNCHSLVRASTETHQLLCYFSDSSFVALPTQVD
jgi:hypothetical protein